ncbi:hypothetical protein Tco_0389792 [Tanacetum coccineum]
MNTTQAQQKALDDALVAPVDRLNFRKCNMRLKTDIKPKEATFKYTGSTRSHSILQKLNMCINSGKTTSFHIQLKDANKDKQDVISRFTKIIIDYFMSKDPSISRRSKMFWHTARDDYLFTSIGCISRHEATQAPKPKYIRKKADSDTSPKKKPVQATKGTKLKSKAKVAKPDKKKQPAKKTKAKGLDGDSEDEDDNDDDGDKRYVGESDIITEYEEEMLLIENFKTTNASPESGFEQRRIRMSCDSYSDNEIASLKDNLSLHATEIPEITSWTYSTSPLHLRFFNPLYNNKHHLHNNNFHKSNSKQIKLLKCLFNFSIVDSYLRFKDEKKQWSGFQCKQTSSRRSSSRESRIFSIGRHEKP